MFNYIADWKNQRPNLPLSKGLIWPLFVFFWRGGGCINNLFHSIEEAVELIGEGDLVAVSGNMEMSPMTLIEEIIRQGIHGLDLLFPGAATINADLLIGAKVAKTIEFTQISLGEFGNAPNFRREVEKKGLRCLEHACPTVVAGLQAGAQGIPFMPVRGLLGTDYLHIRPDFKVISNPYDEEEQIVLVPAIRPHIAIFHAYQADTLGNIVASPLQNNLLLAQASRKVIVSVEDVVKPSALQRQLGTFIPSIYLSSIVHLPGGAYPTGCSGYYPLDATKLRDYARQGKKEEGWQSYLHHWIREDKWTTHLTNN